LPNVVPRRQQAEVGEMKSPAANIALAKAGLMYKFETLELFTYLSACVNFCAGKSRLSPSPVR
jgi:hypothetical protein